jgi:hypothetical protein
VFGVDDGGYRRSNEFWTCFSIRDLGSEPEALRTQLRQQDQRIRDVYAGLSATYQDSKANNDIPFNRGGERVWGCLTLSGPKA